MSHTTIHAASHLQFICHDAALHAGWWPDAATVDPLTFSSKIALVHSELSEALEADRKNLWDDKLPHRWGREVELADAVIRIFDLAGAYGMDLGAAIEEKLEYNRSRADHKPEARAETNGKKY